MALKRDVLAINVEDLALKRADVVIRIARAGGGAPSLFCPSLSLSRGRCSCLEISIFSYTNIMEYLISEQNTYNMNHLFTIAYDTNPLHLCIAITLLQQHLHHDTSSVHKTLLHETEQDTAQSTYMISMWDLNVILFCFNFKLIILQDLILSDWILRY